jgi:hypothetical protein
MSDESQLTTSTAQVLGRDFEPQNRLSPLAMRLGSPSSGSSHGRKDTSTGENGTKRCGRVSWNDQVDTQKWYEWMAYYIPILEWLPKYECTTRVACLT